MPTILAALSALAAFLNMRTAEIQANLANLPQKQKDEIFDRKCKLDQDVSAARARGDDALAERLLDNWAIRSGAAVDIPTPIPSSNQG